MSWTHHKDRVVKAKKAHKCTLCGLPIPAGTTYLARVGFDEDGPLTIKMHLACESHTRDWDEDDWLLTDGGEFRRKYLQEGEKP